MHTLSKTDHLNSKIILNRNLLVYISKKFPGQVVFSRGTSLMERGIINRFSEDIDLIITASRSGIIKHLKNSENFEITNQKNSTSVTEYELLGYLDVEHIDDKIITRLDLVDFNKKFVDLSFQDIIDPNLMQVNDVSIACRPVIQILNDKICILIEDIQQIEQLVLIYSKNSKPHNFYNKPKYTSQLPSSKHSLGKVFIRQMRHYYDIYEILKSKSLDINLLEIEIIRRLEINDNNVFKSNLQKIDVIESFLFNEKLFMSALNEFSDQLWDSSPKYEDIKNSLLTVLTAINNIKLNM